MLIDHLLRLADTQSIKPVSFALLDPSFADLLITRRVPFWGAVIVMRGSPTSTMDWLSPLISGLSDTRPLTARVNLVLKPGGSVRE